MKLGLMRSLCAVLLATAACIAGAQVAPAIDTSPVAAQARSNGLLPGWQHGVFMEIFVRAWRDSNGDGIGDLRGLTRSLDHLQSLGIRGIWLMPITKNADGDHGYATTDFRDIAPEYGTLADFDELLREAHKRNIGVIMDYVINHAAAQHPLFQQALQGPGNPYRDWFVWRDEKPQGWDIWGVDPWYHVASQPWAFTGPLKELPRPAEGARDFYFGTFGPHMPDFNFENPAVLEFHRNNLRFWLNRGLDGFRLDAVPHLVETSAKDWNDQPRSREITKQLQDLILSYPERYVVCEATAEPQVYGDPAVCGGAFAFGFVHHIVKAALGEAESVQQVASYYLKARPTMATFVTSHDRFAGPRLWDAVNGDERRYRVAAASYLLLPGTPFVYYGEPVGQGGVNTLPGDLSLRAPMSWTADPATAGFTTGQPFRPVAPNLARHNVAAQQQDPGSLLNFYKTLIGLRNTLPSIARGSFEHGFAQGLVAGWQRRWEGERSVVLINYDSKPAAAQMQDLPPNTRLVSHLPAGGATATKVNAQGQATLLLAPLSVRVLVVTGGPERRAASTALPAKKAKASGKSPAKKAGAAPSTAGKKKTASKARPKTAAR